ncbi:isochorismatase family protein [Streptomyces sp. NPDC048606]|uniref:isochorismatase family protein n=1 Tax=Streptomyces sp. NPDC048606 TaxID=3154726 RepID=UPI003438B32C
MPTEDALPHSVAPWRVDPGRAALLIHNMQNHLIRAFSPGSSPRGELVGNIARLRKAAGRLGIPVVFSTEPTPGSHRRGLADRLPIGAGAGEGAEAGAGADSDGHIVANLAPARGDHLVTNTRHNAFLGSHLGRILRTADRDQLIVCGLFAHSGVLLTAADAFMNDIQPFVVADAVADLSAEEHELALRWSAARGAVVRTTTTLIKELDAR